MIEPYQ